MSHVCNGHHVLVLLRSACSLSDSALFRSSTAFTSSVRPSWTQRSTRAAPARTPPSPGAPPSSRGLSGLHAHTACCPHSPPPPPHPPHSPITKRPLWTALRGRQTSGCHFAQPSSSRLHCCNAAKGDRLIVLTCGSSVISATLETGVTVAADSGSSLPS